MLWYESCLMHSLGGIKHMRPVVVFSALLALSTAAWAGPIATNQTGTIAISGMAGTGGLGTVGVSTITSHQSELTSFDGILEPSHNTSLGYLNFTTGTLARGSISVAACLTVADRSPS